MLGRGRDAAQSIKQGYTTGARALAVPLDDRPRADARDAERAHGGRRDALRASRRCSSTSIPRTSCSSPGSRAVVFVVGSILDILDGALARAGGKTTPFGAFLDSTTDRVSEGFDARRDRARVLPARRESSRSRSRSRRSPARSSSATPAHAPRRSGCAATSGSAAAPSASSSSRPGSSSRRGGASSMARSTSWPRSPGSPSCGASSSFASNFIGRAEPDGFDERQTATARRTPPTTRCASRSSASATAPTRSCRASSTTRTRRTTSSSPG